MSVYDSGESESEYIVYSEEVRYAKREKRAIVALESTVISHGLPFPENFETAKELENIVRHGGAFPATIAIIRGKIHIGLNESLLLELAQIRGNAVKVSRRDIAVTIASKKTGATTVSATALLASMAGISIFVTGGIGGVHRGVEETMDISADLTELGRTPVAVVCAGVKSILDIPKTLEYLETEGVPVIGYRTEYFPSFFTPSSGIKVPSRLDNAEDIALTIAVGKQLGIKNGMVIGVPISENDAADAKIVESATQQALREAQEQNIRGRDITPFILQRVNELSKGESLKSNIALLKNNARIGTEISVALQHILNNQLNSYSSVLPSKNNFVLGRPIVIGGAVMDLIGKPKKSLVMGTSNPGYLTEEWGGVGRNIGETLNRLGDIPLFISVIGTDLPGKMLLSYLEDIGMDTQGIQCIEGSRTARYYAILDEKGDMSVAIADMAVFEKLTPSIISRYHNFIDLAPIVILDGNIPIETFENILTYCKNKEIKVWFEPTSVAKAIKVAKQDILNNLYFISPNEVELMAIVKEFHSTAPDRCGDFEICAKYAASLLHSGLQNIVVKMGANGVLLGSHKKMGLNNEFEVNNYYFNHFAAPQVEKIVSVTGAGDSFVGGIIHGIIKGESLETSIHYGLQTARLSLMSEQAVSPLLSLSSLD